MFKMQNEYQNEVNAGWDCTPKSGGLFCLARGKVPEAAASHPNHYNLSAPLSPSAPRATPLSGPLPPLVVFLGLSSSSGFWFTRVHFLLYSTIM